MWNCVGVLALLAVHGKHCLFAKIYVYFGLEMQNRLGVGTGEDSFLF